MEVEPQLLAEPNADEADSLVSSNDPDDMANEQTWPTEDEMRDAEGTEPTSHELPDAENGTTPKAVRRVPKGTSEYQATWIVDDDEEGDDDDGDDEMGDGEEEMEDLPEHDEEDEIDADMKKSVAFQDLDMEEEERQCVLGSLSASVKGTDQANV